MLFYVCNSEFFFHVSSWVKKILKVFFYSETGKKNCWWKKKIHVSSHVKFFFYWWKKTPYFKKRKVSFVEPSEKYFFAQDFFLVLFFLDLKIFFFSWRRKKIHWWKHEKSTFWVKKMVFTHEKKNHSARHVKKNKCSALFHTWAFLFEFRKRSTRRIVSFAPQGFCKYQKPCDTR